MARLAGVDIPNEKRIEIALTYIFGVGRTRAKETLAATGINPDIRVKDLTDEQLITLRDYLEGNYKIEGDLDALLIGDVDSGKTCHCDSFCVHAGRAPSLPVSRPGPAYPGFSCSL